MHVKEDFVHVKFGALYGPHHLTSVCKQGDEYWLLLQLHEVNEGEPSQRFVKIKDDQVVFEQSLSIDEDWTGLLAINHHSYVMAYKTRTEASLCFIVLYEHDVAVQKLAFDQGLDTKIVSLKKASDGTIKVHFSYYLEVQHERFTERILKENCAMVSMDLKSQEHPEPIMLLPSLEELGVEYALGLRYIAKRDANGEMWREKPGARDWMNYNLTLNTMAHCHGRNGQARDGVWVAGIHVGKEDAALQYPCFIHVSANGVCTYWTDLFREVLNRGHIAQIVPGANGDCMLFGQIEAMGNVFFFHHFKPELKDESPVMNYLQFDIENTEKLVWASEPLFTGEGLDIIEVFLEDHNNGTATLKVFANNTFYGGRYGAVSLLSILIHGTIGMLEITNKSVFQDCMKAEKAVLFLDFQWSGYTKVVTPHIHDWFKSSALLKQNDIYGFQLYPEGELDAMFAQWLKDCEASGKKEGLRPLRYHGYGDVVWLEFGSVKGAVSVFRELDIRKDKTQNALDFTRCLLDEQTRQFFNL